MPHARRFANAIDSGWPVPTTATQIGAVTQRTWQQIERHIMKPHTGTRGLVAAKYTNLAQTQFPGLSDQPPHMPRGNLLDTAIR